MFRTTHRRASGGIAAAAVCATVLLTACSGASPESSQPTDDAATAQFIACLQAGGLDGRTSENGRVVVKVPIDVDSEGRIEQPGPPPERGRGGEVSLEIIDGAAYQGVDDAESFLEEWGIAPIYADCEAEVPAFEQPESDFGEGGGEGLDPELEAAQTELLLGFAECARENGVANFPDPEEASMVVAESIDEATLRSILTACADDLAESEAPLSVRLQGTPGEGHDLGRVFEDYPELTDKGLMVSAGAGAR